MQVIFLKWCLDPNGRKPVSVNPLQVKATEHFNDAFQHIITGETLCAATRIIMKDKVEYLVQGAVADVALALNACELAAKPVLIEKSVDK